MTFDRNPSTQHSPPFSLHADEQDVLEQWHQHGPEALHRLGWSWVQGLEIVDLHLGGRLAARSLALNPEKSKNNLGW